MLEKNAQTAIEFVIMIGFVLFFFIAILLVVQEGMSDKIKEKRNLAAKEIALIVQDEINLALESSDGYYREFEIPNKVGSQNYDIQIIEDMVYVNTTDNEYAIALPVPKITGNVQKGTNSIQKEKGEIKLNA